MAIDEAHGKRPHVDGLGTLDHGGEPSVSRVAGTDRRRRSPRGPSERLRFLYLLGRHFGDERLPMPWRCDRLTGEEESVGGELDLLGFRSPPPSSDPLLDHLLNLSDVP